MTSQIHTIKTSKIDQGTRLDKFISDNIEGLSRSRCKTIIEAKYIYKDGKIFDDSSYRVKPNEEYLVNIPPATPSEMMANKDIKLDIVYEDEYFLIINKQAGLTVHPGAGNQQETMANALMAHCKDNLSAVGGVARPGIVHRLDKDTSGLILAAKTDLAHIKLSEQIAKRTAKRTYLAFCWGVPKPHSGTIETNIDRHPQNRLKMTVSDNKGRNAITNYEVKEIYKDGLASLVECRLQTGRTHQIRVHLSDKGHPLIGDPLYGNKNYNKSGKLSDQLREFLIVFNRQALHSSQIGVEHPITNTYISLCSDLPEDLKLLKSLLKNL